MIKSIWHFFICGLFGRHKHKTVQEFIDGSRRTACSRCKRSFAMNDRVKTLVRWTPEFHRMYERYGSKIKYVDWELGY